MTEQAVREISPMRSRWLRFKRNKRGYYSLVIFLSVLTFSFGAEIICNDKPLLVHYQGLLLRSSVEIVSGNHVRGRF